MIIPTTVKIGGLDFEVIQSAEVSNEGGNFGSMHSRKQKIFIDPSEKDQLKEQTFIHEVLHAIWWQTGLGSRYKKDKDVIQEEIVDALSSGLHQVLKDNNLLK